MLESYGVNPKPTTIKNPQANAVHERVHLLSGVKDPEISGPIRFYN